MLTLEGLKWRATSAITASFFLGLKIDSAKRFALTSCSYEANYIPIHSLGTEKAINTVFIGEGLLYKYECIFSKVS